MVIRIMMVIFVMWSLPAYALLPQTNDDLLVLEDALRTEFEDERQNPKQMLPMLIATPTHVWQESANDFQDKIYSLLNSIFKDQGAMIPCPDCDTYRLHVKNDSSLQINNGQLSLNDLRLIKNIPKYQNAKTVAFAKETKSGVVLEIVRIEDGVILFYNLADSTKTLDQTRPWFNYQREYERRKREESLSFARLNMGLYPSSSLQLEFLEQWGSRNQHISGAAISMLGPAFAIGAVYHFLTPAVKELDLGLGIYLPLQNIVQRDSDTNAISKLALQVNASYLFSDTVGVFAAGYFGQENGFSIGLTFYNPIWLPFIL